MSGWTKVPRYYGEGLCSPARPSGLGLPGPQHWALQSKGTSAVLWGLLPFHPGVP